MKWFDAYPEDFRDTLSKIFSPNFFERYNDKEYCLKDRDVFITIEVLKGSLLIKKDDEIFPYLRNNKCADNVIIQIANNSIYNIHIFELTKKSKNDDELIEQFEGAFLRAFAILSYFKNTGIGKIYLYFVRKETNTNPIHIKNNISSKRINYNNEYVEIPNEKVNKATNKTTKITKIFKTNNDIFKIKLLKSDSTHSIKNIVSEYEIDYDF